MGPGRAVRESFPEQKIIGVANQAAWACLKEAWRLSDCVWKFSSITLAANHPLNRESQVNSINVLKENAGTQVCPKH